MSTLGTSPAATVAAVYDDTRLAADAAAAVEAAGFSRDSVRHLAPGQTDLVTIEATGLPAYAIDRYLETLRRGRALVIVQAGIADATAIDTLLRDHRPLETAVHAREEVPGEAGAAADDALPPAVRSTAAQNPRPRGHRDPSA